MTHEKFPKLPILHVDDDPAILTSTKQQLSARNIDNVVLCSDSRQVIAMLEEQKFSLILLDLRMPHIGGEELLEQIKGKYSEIPVIMVTTVEGIDIVLDCLKKGAIDYCEKPIDYDRLENLIRGVLAKEERQTGGSEQDVFVPAVIRYADIFKGIITNDTAMFEIFEKIGKWATVLEPKKNDPVLIQNTGKKGTAKESIEPVPVSILITGENGTGKELIARAIHEVSVKEGVLKDQKMLSDNAATMPGALADVRIFGCKEGSFTDAKERNGRLKEVDTGTFFLDEIGDLNLEVQAKLLRVLQERTYYPVGSDREEKTGARFIFATNKNLIESVKLKEFREDLYHRISAFHIHLPPLRERKADILLLLNKFVYDYAVNSKIKMPEIPDSLFLLLENYNFPGNIRELQGMVNSAMSLHKNGPLSLEVFIKRIKQQGNRGEISTQEIGLEGDHSILFGGKLPNFKKMKAIYTNEVMKRAKYNRSEAARIADLKRSTFIRYWENSNMQDKKK